MAEIPGGKCEEGREKRKRIKKGKCEKGERGKNVKKRE